MARIVASIPRPCICSTGSVFHDLMSCIIEQQIHYRSTKRTFERMLAAAEILELTPDNFDVFEERALSSANLALSKLETAVRVVDLFKSKSLDWQRMSDDQVRGELGSIKGVGSWSIDMVLLFTLGRPDVFPADDFHLKQIMVAEYGLDPRSRLKRQMLEVAKKWRGDRSLAVLYLLDWKKLKKSALI